MTPVAVARKLIPEERVLELIKDKQKDRTLREYADELGINPSYLSEIYTGTRSPGEKVLKHFGIVKTRKVIVEYHQEKK